MHCTRHAGWGLALLLLAGCGAQRMELVVDGAPLAFTPQAAIVTANASGGHAIQIVNYAVERDGAIDPERLRAAREGQYRLELLLVKQAANGRQPLAVGEYRPQPYDRVPRDKLVRVSVYGVVGGREQRLKDLDYEHLEGRLLIVSVDGDSVRGRIEVQGEATTVYGGFRARLLP